MQLIANEKIVQGLFSTAPKIEIVNEAKNGLLKLLKPWIRGWLIFTHLKEP
jgi:hypothetical protein